MQPWPPSQEASVLELSPPLADMPLLAISDLSGLQLAHLLNEHSALNNLRGLFKGNIP